MFIKELSKTMNYKTDEFLTFLGCKQDAHHIFVRIKDDGQKYGRIFARPSFGKIRDGNFCLKLDGKAQIYVSVNLCRKTFNKPKISDVEFWTCEYIDLDCERPDHSIPATKDELSGLKSEINDINNWLGMNGMMTGYNDFTGNGYRWLLPIPIVDLRKMKYTDVLRINEQKKVFLRTIKEETGANVDTTVGEFSRITGVPGTMNVKSHGDGDRRREPFRGCDRLEDQNLLDYILSREITEEEYVERDSIVYDGPLEDIVTLIKGMDNGFKSMLENVRSLTHRGKRSNYDYAIAKKLRDYDISEKDCIDILRMCGSSKTKSLDYVRLTVRNAYLS